MNLWKTDMWWASPFNDLSSFRQSLKLPSNIVIHDATLRDGEQTPGVVFSIEDKVEIAKLLDQIGVDRIEAGMPAVSADDQEAIRRISKLGLKARIFTFARAMKEDIDMAVQCGADGVIIEIPTSEPKLIHQFPTWTKDDVIRKSIETVKYSKSRNLETVYFGYDTTRADFSFLKELYARIIEEGKPDSIGIVDTMGCILPGALKEMIRELKTLFDIKIEIHTHNDFGLAVATSFAAMEAGAEVIHTCVNGMGERTGNASLEQVMVGLKVLYGIDVKYNLSAIQELSRAVSRYSNFHMPVNQPVVGDNIFVRESGIGINLVMKTPLAMFALDPAFIGHKAGVVLGKKSGTLSVEVQAEALGRSVTKEQAEQILKEVKALGIRKKSTLTNDEFLAILDKYKD
ncbi:MAG: hypothetical protein A2Y21_10045 [Clostridiales bacterium GWC2_40_7]|nr:MAG: hypothetical protein A2Y21_10045 [Clostridiales bacterium GWC2_40_7]